MNTTRVTSTLGAGAVAAIAAWSSWSHMVGVALHVGERPEVAYLLPLSVDGLLVTASAAMVDDKRSGRTPRWSARVAFAVGVAASLGANIAHAQPNVGARIVAGWPALALLLTVELLSRSGRRARETSAQVAASAPGEPAARPVEPVEVTGPDPVEPVGRAVEPVEVVDPLTAAARTVAGELTGAGRRVTRDGLAAGLRARGHSIGTDRAAALARELTATA